MYPVKWLHVKCANPCTAATLLSFCGRVRWSQLVICFSDTIRPFVVSPVRVSYIVNHFFDVPGLGVKQYSNQKMYQVHSGCMYNVEVKPPNGAFMQSQHGEKGLNFLLFKARHAGSSGGAWMHDAVHDAVQVSHTYHKLQQFSGPADRGNFIANFQGCQPWVWRISGQYSSLQAALLVLLIYYMSEFWLGGVLFFVHYNGKYWHFHFRWGFFWAR